jgi:hypothetical protein
MSTQRAKFELFQRLQNLGFTYDEAAALRRIEMTLQRWAEAECGDSNEHCSTAIERDEETGKPFRVVNYYRDVNISRRYPVADREAGALRRLRAIVEARNLRAHGRNPVIPYHQSDPRGCALYLVKRSDLNTQENMIVRKAIEFGMSPTVKSSETANNRRPLYESASFPGFVDDTPEGIARRFLREKGVAIPARDILPVDQYYTLGLAVCC